MLGFGKSKGWDIIMVSEKLGIIGVREKLGIIGVRGKLGFGHNYG